MESAAEMSIAQAMWHGFWRRFESCVFLKEIRSTFRQRRFFLGHFVSLTLMTLVLLMTIAILALDEGNEPEEIGPIVFVWFVAMQTFVVLFVIPAFSCTAISEEREKKSLDLMLCTRLKAWEVVWGKFLASMAYVFVFLTSSLPLVTLSFLFGGVEPVWVGLAYLGLTANGAMVVMISLLASAVHTASRRAIGSAYALILFGGFVGYGLLGSLGSYAARLTGNFRFFDWRVFGLRDVLVLVVTPTFLWTSAIVWFFLMATNRLKPRSANRSSALRLFFLLFVSVELAILLTLLRQSMPTISANAFAGVLQFFLAINIIVWGLGVVVFGSEPLVLPQRQAKLRWRMRGWRFPVRLFLPGCE